MYYRIYDILNENMFSFDEASFYIGVVTEEKIYSFDRWPELLYYYIWKFYAIDYDRNYIYK